MTSKNATVPAVPHIIVIINHHHQQQQQVGVYLVVLINSLQCIIGTADGIQGHNLYLKVGGVTSVWL